MRKGVKMSLDDLYQRYAGNNSAAKWTPDAMPCPPNVQPVSLVVEPCGHNGHHGHGFSGRLDYKPQSVPATPVEVETIIDGLKDMGHRLGTIEVLVRLAMLKMSRDAAAELAVAIDDAFTVALSSDMARAQCRRLLNDPQALEAAKAVWPSLPPALAPMTQTALSAPVVDHAPQWLRLIRDYCPLAPEDERLLNGSLAMRAPHEALETAKRYVATWQHAANAEPREAARDNAGRRAANNELRGGNRHAR